jgi:hypothetical protein
MLNLTGRYANTPDEHPNAAVLTPTRIAATANGAAFDMHNVDALYLTQRLHAFLETAMAGSNNDIAFVAKAPGSGGTSIRITVAVAGNNTALSVAVSGNDITINSATDGAGAATTTAAQAIAAVAASAAASALVFAFNAPGNDGTGVIAAVSQTALAGPTGTTPTLDQKLQTSIDGGATWLDVAGATFAQVAANLAASGATKVAGPVGMLGRWVSTLGGTTPVYWYTTSAKGRL